MNKFCGTSDDFSEVLIRTRLLLRQTFTHISRNSVAILMSRRFPATSREQVEHIVGTLIKHQERHQVSTSRDSEPFS